MRAVTSFRNQTYQNKRLFILDTGDKEFPIMQEDGIYAEYFGHDQRPGLCVLTRGTTIGALRNLANGYAETLHADIIVHFDDDDFSHPRRIEEQVALLVASGKECVGYNEMLFWRDGEPGFKPGPTGSPIPDPEHDQQSEAWLFQNKSPRYSLGTSLCYWRSTWEKHPFPDKMRGEDYDFVYGCDSAGCSSLAETPRSLWPDRPPGWEPEPRMIASIHAGNGVRVDQRAPHHWMRVPNFDAHCRSVMSL